MTTVVFRDGILAFDSAAFQGDWRSATPVHKGVRLLDGTLLAVAGSLSTLEPWRKWYNGGCKGDRPSDKDSTIIHVRKNGVLHVYEDNGTFTVHKRRPFYVIGSGMPPAHGALLAGATAIEAVRIACHIDPWSGLPVRSLRL